MPRFVDLTGEVFNGRVVTGFSHSHPTSKNYYWKTACRVCERPSVTSGTRLGSGSGCPSCASRVSGRKGLDSQAEGLPVYFIRCMDYVKVGCSKNPERRLKELEVSNPYPLELIKVDVTRGGESYWHTLLADCKHKGEWYRYGDVCEIVDLT